VTTYKKTCVDKGHWECREVEVKPLFAKKKKCCDPCDPCSCKEECPKTKTKRCWVANKCWTETPLHQDGQVLRVSAGGEGTSPSARKQSHCETYKVTVCKCVPHQKCETYTCCVEKKIPYEATRCVTKCVPVQEQVNCCRMVKRCVEKQVSGLRRLQPLRLVLQSRARGAAASKQLAVL